MAARRIAKSSVDWAALAERVSHAQKDHLRVFKAKSDAFVSSVHQHPDKMPEIDFSYYKSRLSKKAMVDEFEKALKALSIPYPKDKDNIVEKLKKEEQVLEKDGKDFIAKMEQQKSEYNRVMEKMDSVPPPDKMTFQMFAHYFPENALDPVNRPTLWPHTPEANSNDLIR